MRVAFIIPAKYTKTGRAEPATYRGRLLIATTPEEAKEVPYSWEYMDLDVPTITVTEWLEQQRDA